MIYGYARVSTATQGRDGNSLEEQVAALTAYGCEEIVQEAYTGKTMERPAFQALLDKLNTNDMLVVTKLDRFARTTIQGVQTVQELFDRGVKVHILNMGLVENTLTGNLILTVMLAFAEYERGMIVERTQTGKAVAKANNPEWREGRKAIVFDPVKLSEYRSKVERGEKTVTECCKELGISRTLWYSRVRKTA